MRRRAVYQHLASALTAYRNCIDSGNSEWECRHANWIKWLVDNKLPSGGGFDNGTSYDLDKWSPTSIVFATSWHHMDQNGYYSGWTHHNITITADLAGGFNIRVGGSNRNDIKDYIAEVFDLMLREVIDDAEILKVA